VIQVHRLFQPEPNAIARCTGFSIWLIQPVFWVGQNKSIFIPATKSATWPKNFEEAMLEKTPQA
jgi:hypothetical protein